MVKDWLMYIAFIVARCALKVFYVYPVKDNRILFTSFNEKRYFCNPKYITERILQEEEQSFELIWAVKNIQEFSFLQKEGITLVEYGTIKWLYCLMTAKIYISNYFNLSYIPFRKNQFVLSTWHGGGAYKKVELAVATRNTFPRRQFTKLRVKNLGMMLSTCRKFSEVMQSAYLIPQEKFFSCGFPRNDHLVNRDADFLYSKIKKHYRLPFETKILLYAPTYRSQERTFLRAHLTSGKYEIDYPTLRDALKKHFKGNWCIFFRCHGFIKKKDMGVQDKDFIDVSDYPDMQELLYVADILITDYSSCMWDFSLTYRPCFIFATDIDRYVKDRGLYTLPSEWPFPLARSNEELERNILNFDESDYVKRVKKHHEDLGSYETGHACEKVFELIKRHVKGNK